MNKLAILSIAFFTITGFAVPMGYLDTPIKQTQKYLWTLKNIENVTEQSLDSLRIDYIMKDATYDVVKEYNVIEDFDSLTDNQKYEINNFILPALFYEADGEPMEGIVGVAHTINNRKNSDKFAKRNKKGLIIAMPTFTSVITRMQNGKYEYNFYQDIVNGRNPRTIPIAKNYYAMLKIAIYMVKGKLDKLSSVPELYVSTHRGQTVRLFKHKTLDMRLIAKVKDSFFYATHKAVVQNDWFRDYSVGIKRNQCEKIRIGNHTFLVAKPNSQLAGLI